MARDYNRLKPIELKRISTPGMYADGGGLYLQVAKRGSKSWIFRYTPPRSDRERYMGLGSFQTFGLSEARTKARLCRQQLHEGIDPISAWHDSKKRAKSFPECAREYIEAHRAGWKNAKHAEQWTSTLATYAEPVLGRLPVDQIDTELVLEVLKPIWYTKTETANRVRGRIENILDWAAVKGYRSKENPARWRGHLDKLLPARSKVQPVTHHAALAYTDLPGFFSELRKHRGVAAIALQVTILTALRTSEVIGARWEEIDAERGVWTVPAERMKSKRPHRVPLTAPVLALLDALPRTGEWVFPSARYGRPISNMAMLKLLKSDMGHADKTVHGFRSTFRDWAAETTSFPRELAEATLAHVLGDKTEAAYQRGDLFVRRAKLMEAWSDYVTTPARTDIVTALKARR